MATSNRELVIQEVEALQGLLRHPGWDILARQIKASADVAMQSMRNAPTQDELLKHTYTYIALADLPTAPEVMIKHREQILQLTKK